ncbi:HAD family hydrolase [Liquorilactobacillus satsumensis]|uniref:Inorganic diphosphatase n=1 Tax=Liquorilactobacillus satsumensis DSM 16230 = JCM 12392 TaxID=1423801 RepID=A0A0R1V5K9_9LACO|nr:HAD family hydrolase [Liquorilactobacillus satsumensis]KRL98819.1 inorganic diphosphatase [Liquorilactobacillus satsumensis DSM 16230 = JCM 12392]MCC7666349.1 HAD family hydrolase [Liquorilactobacillus satsumensis]MCP9312733.1 HAD family hydrolase [Liquorilactobacillus satsumensis]MCP9328001.1 HAD family hydrolase [Liquorilactobacillus satsumensis]MCP9358315.1 HAD family hydrolase [Liquorilactobacillus satsumensis]
MQNFIFDFDGTLADSGKTAVLATQAAFRDFNLKEPTAATVQYYMGIPIEVSFKKMADRDFSDESFAELLDTFRSYYKDLEMNSISLFPQMENVLHQLFNDGRTLFVVSSKHSVALQRNLERLAIAPYFKSVCGSDQVAHFKPAPDGILNLLEGFQLNERESVMIGDAIYDLQMGKAANVQTCGVTWGAHDLALLQKEKPNYLVSEVNQLLELE